VIPLDCSGAAVAPLAGQVQVVGTFATNVTLTDMVLEENQPFDRRKLSVLRRDCRGHVKT
jgi:hypothetical protein